MNPQVPSVPSAQVPDGAVLLDVREDDEWAAGHAPGALHVPMGDVPSRLADLPADGTLHVVCRSGGRSARVTEFLNQNGWDAVNVSDGMTGWAREGRPMTAESGDPHVL